MSRSSPVAGQRSREVAAAEPPLVIDLDGTLLTRTTASDEYVLLNHTFGWGAEEFLRCNLNALTHVPLVEVRRRDLEEQLRKAYAS